MKPKHINLLIVALIACGTVAAQNVDDLPNPLENDNQFPPENHAEDVLDGSGDGTIDTTTDGNPTLEEIEPSNQLVDESSITPEGEIPCPKLCSCNIEGDTFTVDCAGYDLTEFPSPLDEKTTILNLRNNKLTEIPRSVSLLKNLRVLNADNNSIMELNSGSVSELPELKILKLANNRLIEYPNDLKNSLSLSKLEELDLGGNDMRTVLNADTFSNFQSLHTLTLASSTVELKEDICNKLGSLETICTGSCGADLYECTTDKPIDTENELLMEAKLPGTLMIPEDNTDPEIPAQENQDSAADTGTEETPAEVQPSDDKANRGSESPVSDFSLRLAVDNVPSEITQAEKPAEETHQDDATSDPNIGATTSDTKTGGVDKSVIGIIVAAMVVVVAGVTIKKNWSSIKKRFSSSSRPANERVANGNGTTPEEVPLQDKSPV